MGVAGVYKWDNGDVYEGECEDYRFNGKGVVEVFLLHRREQWRRKCACASAGVGGQGSRRIARLGRRVARRRLG